MLLLPRLLFALLRLQELVIGLRAGVAERSLPLPLDLSLRPRI